MSHDLAASSRVIDVPTKPDVSLELLRTYPRDLRQLYDAALARYEARERHEAFLSLGRMGLRMLASVAFSDYRLRHPVYHASVLEALTRVTRPSMGNFLEILRLCLQTDGTGVLDVAHSELPASRRLAAACRAVNDLIEAEARRIEPFLQKRLKATPPRLDWLGACELLVQYRNAAIHPEEHNWPVDLPDYYRLLTPFFEAAVTEVLCAPNLPAVLHRYPFATLERTFFGDTSYDHVFLLDDDGVPRHVTVGFQHHLRRAPADPMISNLDIEAFLLRRTEAGFELHAAYIDLGETWSSLRDLAREATSALGAPEEAASKSRVHAHGADQAGVVDSESAQLPSTAHPSGAAENKGDQLPENLVVVPPGTFRVRDRQRGEVDVTISSPLVVGRFPVTQAEYNEVMHQQPSWFKGDRRPVESVSWLDAVRYCNERSLAEGLEPAYEFAQPVPSAKFQSSGYRLPTEAEWEYCCGGHQDGGYNRLNLAAWHVGNSSGVTHEVGLKSPNDLGLYDMLGNVREWCNDWYGKDYPVGTFVDPTGPETGIEKVLKGGSATDLRQCLDPAWRGREDPRSSSEFIGFRVLRRHYPDTSP